MGKPGRPPEFEGEVVERSFKLNKALDDALSVFAEGVGWSRSSVVRRLLGDALDGVGLISPEIRSALRGTRHRRKEKAE